MTEMYLESILRLPLEVNIIAFLLVLTGLLLLILAASRLWQKRLISATIYSVTSTVLVAIGLVLMIISMNLYTYSRIHYEQDVAEIGFKQLSPKLYLATIDYANHETAKYTLSGDEWQIDARIIKWNLPLYVAGLDPLYRLERISGRYRDIEEERSGKRTVYSLAKNEGLDIWSLSRKYSFWIPWIDAYYGTATYLPMYDQARFKATLSQSGLLARAINDQGRQTIQFWD